MMAAGRARKVALVLPVVFLAGMVVRAELIVARGREFVVRIEGYDPRDLLRGHYLRYRVAWNTTENCRNFDDEGLACGVCFPPGAARENPWVRMMPHPEGADCQAFIRPERVNNLDQYFIPEDMGVPLERAIRDRRAELVIHVSTDGDVVITDLLLDGRPWRDMVQAPE